MKFRIRNRQVTLKIWGRKWCSEGKCAVNFFYAMNNFEIAHFSFFFVINALKYNVKAIESINVPLIHKSEVLLKICIQEIIDIPLILYFPHIFISNTVLEKISRTNFFLKINVYFYLTVPFCLKHNNVVYRWKAYEKAHNLTFNMLKSVAKYGSYCYFS